MAVRSSLHVIIEFYLEGSPALVNVFRPQLTSDQVNNMKGQDGQEQMCFNLLILTVVDRAESQVGFYRLECPFNLPNCQ